MQKQQKTTKKNKQKCTSEFKGIVTELLMSELVLELASEFWR